MTKYEFIITLIKERILKPKTIIILCVVFLFCLYIFPLFYHFVNKILNPDLKKSTIRIGNLESANEYKTESYKFINRENPESLDDKDNTILRLKKQRIVDLTLMTVATPTLQIKDSPIAKDLAERLKDLRISDPDSEIIPLTEDFLKSYDTFDFIRDYEQGKIQVENDVWR